ncbi:MAG TPA: hypothetical protein VMZ91_03960 [Candidatus Paceibacterota bacterium]|nr:hypothetical protein [Candidatus Paceibacterota bacterium]
MKNEKGLTTLEIFIMFFTLGIALSLTFGWITISGTKIKNSINNKTEIAKVLAAEACGNGRLGMWIVANTIDNRSKKWSISHFSVITQLNQYYGYTNKNKETLYDQCKEESEEIARFLITGELYDFTNGGMYIRRRDEKRQPWHEVKTLEYKDHIIYKEKEK